MSWLYLWTAAFERYGTASRSENLTSICGILETCVRHEANRRMEPFRVPQALHHNQDFLTT